MTEQEMTPQQVQFFQVGEQLCTLFGCHYSHTEEYRQMMEGCFTQRAQLMAQGLEKLVSRHSGDMPLFLRGMLFQVTQCLKNECLDKAFKAAERAKDYSSSLGFSSFKRAS